MGIGISKDMGVGMDDGLIDLDIIFKMFLLIFIRELLYVHSLSYLCMLSILLP